MKRLLDETTDDFTRALLVAGIEQRPPAGNKRKVLIALGAGSALGLFSSHALAWLGTSGGKLSVLGVALGMAGAAYVVEPWSEAETKRGPGAPLARVSPAVVSVPESAPPPEPSLRRAVSEQGNDGVEPRDVASTDSAASSAVTPAVTPDGASAVRPRPVQLRSKRARVASAATEPHGDGALPAASALPEGAAPVEVDPRSETASLEAEVRLVDDMRWAARHNNREALARLVATYHASFPDGQLEQEVSAFAARLERSAAP
jgi:hypothetical protein